jgi:hypothetical protein
MFLINKTYQLHGKNRERQIHINVNANITLDLQLFPYINIKLKESLYLRGADEPLGVGIKCRMYSAQDRNLDGCHYTACSWSLLS